MPKKLDSSVRSQSQTELKLEIPNFMPSFDFIIQFDSKSVELNSFVEHLYTFLSKSLKAFVLDTQESL